MCAPFSLPQEIFEIITLGELRKLRIEFSRYKYSACEVGVRLHHNIPKRKNIPKEHSVESVWSDERRLDVCCRRRYKSEE